ncbi:hypothetical protein VTG60DRAFT_4629 [Thermothelomyces hinnuleus]
MYCNFRRQTEQRVEDLVVNLLKQLTRGLPVFPAVVKDLYTKHGSGRTRLSLSGLVRTFASAAALYEERVFIVVDAVDECREADGCRSNVLSALLGLQSVSGSRVSLFATSRPGFSDIVETFEEHPSLEIVASQQDIERYLHGHMGELGRVVARRQDLQQEIVAVILEAVDGMFLLAHFFFQSLRDRLTATQIQHAWAVRDTEDEIDEDSFPEIEEMTSVCGGLVTVDKGSDTIQLVHYTMQDYLEERLNPWFPDAHSNMVKICTSYLFNLA